MKVFKFGEEVISDDYSVCGFIVFDKYGCEHVAHSIDGVVEFIKTDHYSHDWELVVKRPKRSINKTLYKNYRWLYKQCVFIRISWYFLFGNKEKSLEIITEHLKWK